MLILLFLQGSIVVCRRRRLSSKNDNYISLIKVEFRINFGDIVPVLMAVLSLRGLDQMIRPIITTCSGALSYTRFSDSELSDESRCRRHWVLTPWTMNTCIIFLLCLVALGECQAFLYRFYFFISLFYFVVLNFGETQSILQCIVVKIINFAKFTLNGSQFTQMKCH